MIKAILFDLGGVVVFNDLNAQLKDFSEELNIDIEILRELEIENHIKLILGKKSVKEFCSSIKSRFSLGQDSLTLSLIWNRIYNTHAKLNFELLEKLKELKKDYKLGLITNIEDLPAQTHQRQRLYQNFKVSLLSCRIGVAKPDIKIYARAISSLGLKGSECIFIDNKKSNLVPAKEFGMKTILYKDNEQLFKDLKKLKCLK
jgi:epoxide hydrolase-like predicted phosphatase